MGHTETPPWTGRVRTLFTAAAGTVTKDEPDFFYEKQILGVWMLFCQSKEGLLWKLEEEWENLRVGTDVRSVGGFSVWPRALLVSGVIRSMHLDRTHICTW